MAAGTHLTRWLIDLHAVETQALFQLRRARRLVAGTALATHLDEHVGETLLHRRAVQARLAERGRSRSPLLDVVVTANRVGFFLYTAAAPDAPGKLVVDSYAYEFLEIGAYGVLARGAEVAGEPELSAVAGQIAQDERIMAQRLQTTFDWAVDASAHRVHRAPAAALPAHVRDAHALEVQSSVLMALGARVAGAPSLAAHYRRRLELARVRRRRLQERLQALGTRPSRIKTAGMGLGGAGWAAVWAAQRDTAAKLAPFAYAAEHLLVASYALLWREALRAGDRPTEHLARELGEEARVAGETLAALLPAAADAALGLPRR